MPRQEVPAAVLALSPERAEPRLTRRLVRGEEVAELLPPRRAEAVHPGIKAPARWLGQGPGLHGRHPPGIPEDLVGPVATQLPHVASDERYGLPPPRARDAVAGRSTGVPVSPDRCDVHHVPVNRSAGQ